MRIRWPSLKFPPINLWTAPRQPAMEDTMEVAEARQKRDAIQDQLCARIEELEHDKATLAELLDQAEAENARMRAAVRRARIYAGDNLPAAPGLAMVSMLENAMKEGAR